MQAVDSTILRTPLAIYDEVKKYFNSARGEVELDQDCTIALSLKLSEAFPPILLRDAIDAREFLKSMTQMKTHAQLNQILGRSKEFLLDVDQFTLVEPLKDWQKFRRVMYESQGARCEDVILDYLQNPEDKTQVVFLGFAPHQLEERLTENDCAYFRKLILNLTQSQRTSVLASLRKEYPCVKQRLCKEQAEQEAKELREKAKSESNFYQTTLDVLKSQVIGQDRAAEKMAATLVSQKNQSGHKVFLFVGPTGVGKTELAKAVSKTKQNRFAMFAMNQYQNETDITKLFGSSSGYVGSTDKPHFAKEIDLYGPVEVKTDQSKKMYKVSNLVLLFDEFEKAHSTVKQSLLTLFDEGHCVVNYTSGSKNIAIRYNFNQCVIICTSNLYQQEVVDCFHKGDDLREISEKFKQYNRTKPVFEGSSKKSFSPELLGRITIIPFGPIPRGESYQSLLQLKLKAFCSHLKEEISCQSVDIENPSLMLEVLESKLYGEGTDIRRVGQYFDSVKDVIYANSCWWGSLESKKIVFSCNDQGTLSVTPFTFIAGFEEYYPLVAPIELP